MPDALTEAVIETVQTDPQLRDRLGVFISNVLDEAEYLMVNGTTAQKTSIVNKLVPHLVKRVETQEEDSEMAMMKAAIEEQRLILRAMVGQTNVIPIREVEQPTEDNPTPALRQLAPVPQPPMPTGSAKKKAVKVEQKKDESPVERVLRISRS